METKNNKIVFLKGYKTILRPLNKETDLENVCRWINDREVTQFLNTQLPQMRQNEEQWFDDLVKNKNDIVLALETLQGNFIGTMGLHHFNWHDRTAITGTLIGEKEYWGQGYGTDAKMFLLNYAFNSLNLHRISSSAIAFNKSSLNYNLKCGYQIEGRRRQQFFRDGKYWDEIMIGVLKEEFEPVWKKYQKKFEKQI